MTRIIDTVISNILPNAHRRLGAYPYNDQKIAALRQSIRDVGLWEGVIGRKAGDKIELAFGHHRIEAARRELGDDASVSIIRRDLSDEQMLQFMGRENLEDYNADFLVMLETWESAQNFIGGRGRQNLQAIEVASLLGWTQNRTARDGIYLKNVAEACNDASKLIAGGHISRDQLAGLSVKSVREICQTVVARHRTLDAMAKTSGRPTRELNQAKQAYGKAAASVAKDVREGVTPQREIKGRVDLAASGFSRDKTSPLFAVAGKALVEGIARMMDSDAAGQKLREIEKALHLIELDDDLNIVKRIAFECGALSERSAKWQRRFTDPEKKVVKLKEIS